MKHVDSGISFVFETTVTESQSAINVGSGTVPVFGTPAMIALMEKASNLLMDPYFDEGETSVGIQIDVRHSRASAIGSNIKVGAKLIEIEDNKRLIFEIWAEDDKGEIGRGTLKRAIISIDRFMARLN